MRKLTLNSSIGQLYDLPAGRDIVDKILLQLGASTSWVTNPVVRNLRVGALKYATLGKLDDSFLSTLLALLNQDDTVTEGSPQRDTWWKRAVFYQIYPRSFRDSNGDGIGDLVGIIDKLDYLQELGINALWLSPIYDSPNDDMGYDIRDYRAIMQEFGTMEDFDRLLAETHQRGMRLIMDLVVNHTSDEHDWFQQALADPESPYRDYYFFRGGGRVDQPPNNWDSFFSGSAWRYFPEQDVWALHMFSSKQMDLNWENEAVRREVADIANWWLERGVDGFRLDVINYISKVPGLPEGSPIIGELMGFKGIEHFFYGPRLHQYLNELQLASFQRHDAFSVGETPGIGTQMGKLLTAPERQELDLVFNFDHLETPGHVRQDDYQYDLNYLKDYYIHNQGEYSGCYWMSLFLENHDNPRMISKVDPRPVHHLALGKLLGMIQLTLRGTPFLFQGQELGLINQKFRTINDLRDIESINLYQDLLADHSPEEAFRMVLAGTRDHARTGMPWNAENHGGFTEGIPWIEGDDSYLVSNAFSQQGDPDSILNFYREMLRLRADSALAEGTIEFLDTDRPNYWSYRRVHQDQEFLVQFNLGSEPLRVDPSFDESAYRLVLANRPIHGDEDLLTPYEARLWERTTR